MTIISQLVPLLDRLEDDMRQLHLWQDTPPSDDKLLSSQPFSVDTLEAHEWLQWVFIVKMRKAIEQQSVPLGFSLEPYFSQVWQEAPQYQCLLVTISAVDEVCRAC